ncbi:hypothetical protein FRX31_018758 [Thalictrum thalictroides]|uniref:DUF4283 domain-containing protein n=1 Tax=Thalictrum thalictroides TaxID=46969 RepID=A0A7J6W5N9_THATH|nr:hypothetical protein FRX31_018758 [Thalictrum thalictroides]
MADPLSLDGGRDSVPLHRSEVESVDLNNLVMLPVQQPNNVEGGSGKITSFAEKVRGVQPQVIDVSKLPSPGMKGFFMVRLSCEEDLVRIWGSSWKFGGQMIRLTKWTPDFDPDLQKSTNALLWVKFPKLKQQYWDYELLMSMGKALGSPVGIDRHTLERDFGYYAMVLVDIDLSKTIPSSIHVEEEGGNDFIQEIEIQKMPRFCTHCKSIGHAVFECKSLQKVRQIEESKDNSDQFKRPYKKNNNSKFNKQPAGEKQLDLQGENEPQLSQVGVSQQRVGERDEEVVHQEQVIIEVEGIKDRWGKLASLEPDPFAHNKGNGRKKKSKDVVAGTPATRSKSTSQ